MPHFPCITVWQPWASLIAAGAKPYEFRSWPVPREHRGRSVAIHAGSRQPRDDEIRALIYQLERGDIRDNQLVPDLALPVLRQALALPASLRTTSVLCTARLGEPVRCAEIAPAVGTHMWAWPLTDVAAIEPMTVKGRQGFWWVRLPEGAARAPRDLSA